MYKKSYFSLSKMEIKIVCSVDKVKSEESVENEEERFR